MSKGKKWRHVTFGEQRPTLNPLLLAQRVSELLNVWGVGSGGFVVLPHYPLPGSPNCMACLVYTDKAIAESYLLKL